MKSIAEILEERQGIQLDIGCGEHKQPGYVGLDIQPLEGVDIVHDWLNIPWPLPDACVLRAIASHVIEHVPRVLYMEGGTRWMFIDFMDEVWRVLHPEGQFALAFPYCISPGFYQDPTHVNPCNETTWLYFDPETPIDNPGLFWNFYKPKPWKIMDMAWDPSGNMEVLLRKRVEK